MGHDAVEDHRLRKLGTSLLAVPVILVVYLTVGVRSAGRFRAVGFVGAAGVIALVLMAGGRPAPLAAAPQSMARTVSAALLDTVVTGHGLTAPITLQFDAPMDAPSVLAALRIQPESAVTFTWDAPGSTLTIRPVNGWSADTLYAVSVDASAHAADGSPLAGAVHALIMTTRAGTGTLGVTRPVGARVALDTAFAIHLDRAVAPSAVQAALVVEPGLGGTVTAGSGPGDYVFTPAAPLTPNTTYQLTLSGLADGAGIPFRPIAPLTVRTLIAPAVVRFRPLAGAASQVHSAVLSVRFTARMDRATTAAAFRATVAGKAITGRITWAESNQVLVFTPAASLPYGAKITMSVGPGATSASGVALGSGVSASFTVEPKPAPAKQQAPAKTTSVKPATTTISHPKSTGGSGAAGAVSGSWAAVERYYLGLMNCTRTGGWVTSSGSCSSPGGRDVAPLTLSDGISSEVSRPYAKYLADNDVCNHFYQGTPGDRLRRAGYASYDWGENIGCENMSPYNAVLGDHLFFQSEKSYNGGHYRNLMNALYTEVGIGVWVSGGRVRLVVDFYRP